MFIVPTQSKVMVELVDFNRHFPFVFLSFSVSSMENMLTETKRFSHFLSTQICSTCIYPRSPWNQYVYLLPSCWSSFWFFCHCTSGCDFQPLAPFHTWMVRCIFWNCYPLGGFPSPLSLNTIPTWACILTAIIFTLLSSTELFNLRTTPRNFPPLSAGAKGCPMW